MKPNKKIIDVRLNLLFCYMNFKQTVKFYNLIALILKKYHVFATMGRFQLELIYLYFPPSSHLVYLCFVL